MNALQHERIADLCAELRLKSVDTAWTAAAQAQAAKEGSFGDFLEDVLRSEAEGRRVRARGMAARVAGFPAIKTMDDYDFAFATGAPRKQLFELASLAFVERAGPDQASPRDGEDPAAERAERSRALRCRHQSRLRQGRGRSAASAAGIRHGGHQRGRARSRASVILVGRRRQALLRWWQRAAADGVGGWQRARRHRCGGLSRQQRSRRSREPLPGLECAGRRGPTPKRTP